MQLQSPPPQRPSPSLSILYLRCGGLRPVDIGGALRGVSFNSLFEMPKPVKIMAVDVEVVFQFSI